MAGAGTMIAGFGPAGGGSSSTPRPPMTGVVAWYIDGDRMTYRLDDTGNPVGMDGTDQRVLLKIVDASFALAVITPNELSRQEQAYRNTLATMVKEGSISDVTVSVIDGGGQRVRSTVNYKNLGTSRAMTVTL